MARKDPFEEMPPASPSPRPYAGVPSALPRVVGSIVLGLVLLAGFGIFQWFFCRIEVPAGHLAVLIKKTGKDLPAGEILGPDDRYKGIRRPTLREGRYFYNPLFWDWQIFPVTEIRQGEVGILVRRFGREAEKRALDEGRVTALPGDPLKGIAPEKGIVPGVLLQGRHDINPWEFDVIREKATAIPPGFVGIQTNLEGRPPATPNAFLVGPGEKGVLKEPLPPGTYNVNPFETRIDTMDTRAHPLEITDADDLVFPSSDGFPISVNLTVVWAVDAARAPEVFVRIGELADDPAKNEILQKLLLPAVRGLSRIEGSKYSAANYISGESRLLFQNRLQAKLKEYCEARGILVNAVLVNKILPPNEIARPIQDREIAKEELGRNKNQLQEAIARQSLMRQTALVDQERAKVEAETGKAQALIAAKNRQDVAVIEQEKLLTVARTDLESARKQAEAIRARGAADAEVIRLKAIAEAEALKRSVSAFRDGAAYASYEFSLRIAPRLESIFADTDSPFGRLFEGFLPSSRPGDGPAPRPPPAGGRP